MKDKILHFLAHYFYGLLSQSFNGAMTAGVATIANDQLNLPAFGHTFLVALAVHALIYFKTHPLPEELPDDCEPAKPAA